MCNCKQHEFELLPEFEVMLNEDQEHGLRQQNRPIINQRNGKTLVTPSSWRGLPEMIDTMQLEFEGSGKCESHPGGIVGGGRSRVRDTKIVPFKYICKIEMPGGHCTGTLIAPNKVLTAAHCLFDRNSSSYYPGPIRIIPGKNGPLKANEPFGSTTSIRVNVPDGYRTAADYTAATPFDYAVITLRESIGRRIGYWNRLAYKPDTLLLRNKVNTAGYPGDIDPDKQVKAYDQNVAVHPQLLEFKLDVCGGQSGSPIWVRWQQFRAIVGVVKRVDDPGTAAVANIGVRMTPTVLDNIKKWVKA